MVVKVVLTFILHLRHWDWWGMFIPLQVTLFCSNHCLYLFSSFSDPLFSFSPPSSINHFPASPSSVDPLFMSFHPMLVLSLTANRCFLPPKRFPEAVIQCDESRCWCCLTQWTHQRLKLPWLIQRLTGKHTIKHDGCFAESLFPSFIVCTPLPFSVCLFEYLIEPQ